MGAIWPSGDSVQVPPVSAVTTSFIKWYLAEDMIARAQLSALPWPPGFAPTIAGLRRWVRTRHGMPLLSDATKDSLAQAAKDRL